MESVKEKGKGFNSITCKFTATFFILLFRNIKMSTASYRYKASYSASESKMEQMFKKLEMVQFQNCVEN
jgi:hypothetical protein